MDYTKEIVALRTSFEEIEKKLSLVRKLASVDYQTQIDQINSDVNACQNSLSSIEQDLLTINETILSYQTLIETNSTDIATIKTQIENIETALTACQSSISTLNSQVSTLQFDMGIAKGNIDYLTETLNSTVFDLELLKVTVQTAKTNIATLQTQMLTAQDNIATNANNISTNANNIATLQGQMTTAQDNIATNATDIDTLQSDMSSAQTDIETNATNLSSLQSSLADVAFSGDYDDLINKPSGSGGSGEEEDEMASEVMTSSTDEIHETMEFEMWDANNQTICPNLYFICSPEVFIEGNVDVYLFSYQPTNNPIIRLYYGETLVYENTFSIESYEKIVNFPFKFYPVSNKGYFRITSQGVDAIIKYATFHITSSKNFLFLDRNLKWTVNVYNHKYYIIQNFKFRNKYYILDSSNFAFTSPQSLLGTGIWGTLLPKPTYTSTTLTIDESDYYVLCRNLWDYRFCIDNSSGQTYKVSKTESYGFDYTYFSDDCATLGLFTVTSVYGATKKLTYWSGTYPSVFVVSYKPYKLNGVEVASGCWVANIAVKQLDMTNAPFNVFQGSVAVRDDGMCIFFPHYNATYCVELGIGRRPTAFRQENGNIHVYIGRQNYVIKFVLVINQSTNQYEISTRKKIYGVQEYYETLDNKAIYLVGDQIKLISL